MKNSIKSLSFFALAVVAGASAFGLFLSSQAHARSIGGGPYCPGVTADGPTVTMCYNGSTVYSVPPATQSAYLNNGTGSCGACATSGK